MKYLNEIVLGDCKEVMKELPDNSIDLIMTDPPYTKEFLYTYDYLAEQAPRILKSGGSLLTLVGHYALPEVFRKFDGKLKFRWIICIFQSRPVQLMAGITVNWKPMLWFVKDKFSHRWTITDTIYLKPDIDKRFHEWQQDESWCRHYIQVLCPKDGVVLDPFIGSGTVAVVCKKLGRTFIGIEIDPKYCEIARQRLADTKIYKPESLI